MVNLCEVPTPRSAIRVSLKAHMVGSTVVLRLKNRLTPSYLSPALAAMMCDGMAWSPAPEFDFGRRWLSLASEGIKNDRTSHVFLRPERASRTAVIAQLASSGRLLVNYRNSQIWLARKRSDHQHYWLVTGSHSRRYDEVPLAESFRLPRSGAGIRYGGWHAADRR